MLFDVVCSAKMEPRSGGMEMYHLDNLSTTSLDPNPEIFCVK